MIKNPMQRGNSRKTRGLLLSLSLLGMTWWPMMEGALSEEAVVQRPPFATVGEQTISAEQYENAVQMGIRQTFYHSKLPESELAKFQREVGEKLVDRLLLMNEAKQQGLIANQEEISQTVAKYEKRYANSEKWQQSRDKMLGPLVQELEEQSLLKQLEQKVRSLPEPTDAEVRGYFTSHPEKFTQPEQRKLSLILLRVDPSGGGAAWESARQEATTLVSKLKDGAPFTELAKIHSGDLSADAGGEMGMVHKGTLAATAEEAINKLTVGQVTDPPVMVLEGMAIFRLDAIQPSRAMAYEDVKGRAAKLLGQEKSDQAWEGLKQRLRTGKAININQQYYQSQK